MNAEGLAVLNMASDKIELARTAASMAIMQAHGAGHPVMATPQNPNPPTPDELRYAAQQNEAAALQAITEARMMLSRFSAKTVPDAPPPAPKEPNPAMRLVGAAGEAIGAAP